LQKPSFPVANILDKIISDKRKEVEEGKRAVSVSDYKERAQAEPAPRNFHKEVSKKNSRGLNVIAEIKKASPSAGVIRENFDPLEIATIYDICGADAISVLTDEKYFQGKLEYIRQIKETVPQPVLRKDFIIDAWQVYQSRAAGADAILLIAETLPPGEVMDLMITASELRMTVLLEFHQLDNLLKMRSMLDFPKGGYSLLGINNRDLSTMKVDLNTTARLGEFINDKSRLVTESGIKTREDVDKIKSFGVNACLIGQTLCESESISEKFTELFG
jgi:indole-3-glycerol phosphate synthase